MRQLSPQEAPSDLAWVDNGGRWKLRRHEQPWHGLRRVIAAQILKVLADFETIPQEEALHNFRKATKQIRALLRIPRKGKANGGDRQTRSPLYDSQDLQPGNTVLTLPGQSPQNPPKKLSEIFRSLARMAAPVRDLQVQIRVLNRLQKKLSRPAELRLSQFLQERLLLQIQLIEPITPRILAGLREAMEILRNWPPEPLTIGDLKRAWKKAQTAALKAGKTAHSDPGDEVLHQWRKRAKTFLYMTRFLRGAPFTHKGRDDRGERHSPSLCPPHSKRLKKLTALLGDNRDLALLERSLARIHSKAKRGLLAHIANERIKLQRKILRLSWNGRL